MPQLDTLSFFSQFTWFALIFLVLYFRIVIYYLPKIAQTLKIRRKVKEEDLQEISNLVELSAVEKRKIEEKLKECMSVSIESINTLKEGYQIGVSNAMTELNNSSLKTANQLYIDSVVNLTTAHHLLTKAVK